MIDTGSMWEGLVPLLTALVPPRSVYLAGDLETIKWRNLVQSRHIVYLEFPLRTPVQKVTQVRHTDHCAHGEISVPGSSHFEAEKSWSSRRVQSRAMAGDGSDQRALQYEQTLVSLWTLFAGHCFLTNTETRLRWKTCGFNAARFHLVRDRKLQKCDRMQRNDAK